MRADHSIASHLYTDWSRCLNFDVALRKLRDFVYESDHFSSQLDFHVMSRFLCSLLTVRAELSRSFPASFQLKEENRRMVLTMSCGSQKITFYSDGAVSFSATMPHALVLQMSDLLRTAVVTATEQLKDLEVDFRAPGA